MKYVLYKVASCNEWGHVEQDTPLLGYGATANINVAYYWLREMCEAYKHRKCSCVIEVREDK